MLPLLRGSLRVPFVRVGGASLAALLTQASQWLPSAGPAPGGACHAGSWLPRGARSHSTGTETLQDTASSGSLACHPGQDPAAAADEVLFVVDRLLGEGDAESAMATLEAGAQRLSERFGLYAAGLLPVYGQLALLKFVDGDYQAAVHTAQRCYYAAVQREGEGARCTLPLAVRFGVMLLASGDAEGALPLLANSSRELERVMEEVGEAAGVATDVEQLQSMFEQLFEYAVALGEATYYLHLARIARNGSGGKEAVLGAEEGLLGGLEMLKHALEADHVIVGAALREHGRLVQRTLERGHRLAHIELVLQNKRLHDAVKQAAMFEYTTTDEEE